MQVVELYISNTRVDLFEDESVTITDTIVNAKDVAKVFTAFSQQFSLPASSTNNKIFKHYYNFEISGGFDARIRVSAILKLNGVDYKIGKVKLNSVPMRDNKAYSYKVVFFGDTVTLNDVLGEDKLNDLSFVDKTSGTTTSTTANKLVDSSASFTTTVSIGDRITNTTDSTIAVITAIDSNTQLTISDNIFTSGESYIINLSPFYDPESVYYKMQLNTVNTEQNSVVAPLITHTQRLYFDSVSSAAGVGNLKFDTGEDHGVLYSDLKYAIRINEIIKAIENTYTIANNYNSNIVFSNDFFNFSNKAYSNLFMWLHRKSGAVDTLSQQTSYPIDIDYGTGGGGDWAGINNTSLIINSAFDEGTDQTFSWSINPVNNSVLYDVSVAKDGIVVFSLSQTSNTTNITANDLGGIGNLAGTYVTTITSTVEIEFSNVIINFFAKNEDYPNGLSEQIATGTFFLYTKLIFEISAQIPDIKIIDFLTGLFKMFNLVAYVKADGVIYVDTLDNFYATSTTYDVTKYIDVSKSSVDVALPYKEILFTYKGVKSFLADKYTKLFNSTWGAEKYNDNNRNLDGGIYKVEAPFEHMMFERLIDENNGSQTNIVWGYSVNENQEPYIGSPMLFYPNIRSGQGNISYRASGSFPHTSTSIFSVPMNSVFSDSSTSTANNNFGVMTNEFTGDTSFTGTLYNNYYNNYILNIFKQSSRIVRFDAYLPLHIILNYTLADILIISGKQYRINSLNINLINNKTQLELITI